MFTHSSTRGFMRVGNVEGGVSRQQITLIVGEAIGARIPFMCTSPSPGVPRRNAHSNHLRSLLEP